MTVKKKMNSYLYGYGMASPSRRPSRRTSPTRWWRLARATALDRGALDAMKSALANIGLLGEGRWRAAAAGDATAAIGIALELDPADHHDQRFDLVMTALAICAAEGSAAARLVMSGTLRKLPGAGRFEARLATNWLALGLVELLARARSADAADRGADR